MLPPVPLESLDRREPRWSPRYKAEWEQMHTQPRGGGVSQPGLLELAWDGLETSGNITDRPGGRCKRVCGTGQIFAWSSRPLILEILTFLLPGEWGGVAQEEWVCGEVYQSFLYDTIQDVWLGPCGESGVAPERNSPWATVFLQRPCRDLDPST